VSTRAGTWGIVLALASAVVAATLWFAIWLTPLALVAVVYGAAAAFFVPCGAAIITALIGLSCSVVCITQGARTAVGTTGRGGAIGIGLFGAVLNVIAVATYVTCIVIGPQYIST
jgi:hypothetical protein